MGWHAGERIDVDVVHGTVSVSASRTGRRQIGSRGDIGLPIAVRNMCRIQYGETLLLNDGLLVIHPAATITRLLARPHGRILTATGQRP